MREVVEESQWKDAEERFRERWIELGTNHALMPDRTRNEAALRKDAAALEQVLSVLHGAGETGVLLVPDTNSLVDQPDPTLYRTIAGRNDFKVRPAAARSWRASTSSRSRTRT